MSTIPKLLKLKDYITLTGTTLGVISLMCGAIGTREYLSLGFFLVSITLGTDLLDGYVARKTGTVNKIGIELDSLSDALTFGIAPSILTFQAFKTGGIYDVFLVIGCICFALGAILRLARFNISEDPGYTGVPTPLSAMLLIAFFYLNYFFSFALGGISYPFPSISTYMIPIILIFIAWCNITTFITFAEKGKLVYVVFIVLAPLNPIFGIIGILNPSAEVSLFISMFFLVCFILFFLYILNGFFRTSKIKRHQNQLTTDKK